MGRGGQMIAPQPPILSLFPIPENSVCSKSLYWVPVTWEALSWKLQITQWTQTWNVQCSGRNRHQSNNHINVQSMNPVMRPCLVLAPPTSCLCVSWLFGHLTPWLSLSPSSRIVRGDCKSHRMIIYPLPLISWRLNTMIPVPQSTSTTESHSHLATATPPVEFPC